MTHPRTETVFEITAETRTGGVWRSVRRYRLTSAGAIAATRRRFPESVGFNRWEVTPLATFKTERDAIERAAALQGFPAARATYDERALCYVVEVNAGASGARRYLPRYW